MGKKAVVNQDQLLLDAARMAKLFAGNLRSVGRFDPARERAWTDELPPTQADFEAHLQGKVGVGVVPIQDDDTVVWAAIDMDNHDTDEDLPLSEVAEKAAIAKLPLVCCRSKSGGIHAYIFLDKPQPAARIRTFMNQWASVLGYGGSEVFPKQSKLVYGKDQKRQFGNWINLPYMGGTETIRYAYHGGKKLSLGEFLDLAEKLRVTDHDLRSLSMAEHPDAPPCIQALYSRGVAQGHRNEALYNVVVYLKKVHPEGFEAKAVEANTSVFTKPLPRAEMQRTINSASRPDCGYRCNEEPIRSYCDRETCRMRKYGITSADLERLNTSDSLPIFTDLVKYSSEPVRWDIKIDGVKISNVGTADLLDWRCMRQLIADRLTRIVPMIKGQEWERILHPLMGTCRIVETPDDASVAGVIRSRLREFASKADLINRGQDVNDRKAILRGLPVVQVVDGDRAVVFRADDFINFLKRTKSEELKGVNLWMAVKEIGCSHTRMRIPGASKGENNINVWYLPVAEVLRNLDTEAEPVEFRSEM